MGIYEFFFFFCYLKVENGLAELAFLKNKGHIIIDTCIQREGSEFCKVIVFPSFRTTNLLNIRMISGLKNFIDQVAKLTRAKRCMKTDKSPKQEQIIAGSIKFFNQLVLISRANFYWLP